MQAEQLFRQALYCFGQQNVTQGMFLLKQAAEAGLPSAVLFYADRLFKDDKAAAYDYLERAWQQGVAGALHRRALLQFFFDEPTELSRIFLDLHQEAEQGHLHSLIALLAMLNDSPCAQYYQALLTRHAGDLAEQLIEVSSQATTPSYTSTQLQAAFIDAVTQSTTFHTEVVAAEISLIVAKRALPDIACEYLKLRFGPLLKPAMVVDPKTGQPMQDPYRTGSMLALGPEYLDWIVLEAERKMSAFANFPRAHGEVTNIIHYAKAQRYLPHYDAILGQGDQFNVALQNGGQRMLTVLAYLHTVEAGGETEFPKLALQVNACQGDLLMFHNINVDGHLLELSYHAGNPVLTGEKWILSKWARQCVTDYGTLVYR